MEDDPFLRGFDPSDLKIAEEFLTSWLPFLTRGLCQGCSDALHDRVRFLNPGHGLESGGPQSDGSLEGSDVCRAIGAFSVECSDEDSARELQNGFDHIESSEPLPRVRLSWADMAQMEELGENDEVSMKNFGHVAAEGKLSLKKVELTREQRERIRFENVGRKKDFVCFERIGGRVVNIMEGLELHTSVFSAVEQKRIVDFVYELQEKGRNGELGEHTYSEPRKWMRGKGRATIQFGCCYNYAERNGAPPGILRAVMADPIPTLFKTMIKRLVGWHVMPASCVPDSCIVNIYEPDDCIPPHIDSHDFVRPFCTVSFLSECNILFGSNLKIIGPGEFSGPVSVPLPVGSVLVLKGNGADVAKHCVPAVPHKRISITFRKMDKLKWPFGFATEPDLQNIKPYDMGTESESQKRNEEPVGETRTTTRRRNNGRYSAKGGFATEPDHQNVKPFDMGAENESRRVNEEPVGETRATARRRNNGRYSNAKGKSHRLDWPERPTNHQRRVYAAS